MGIRKALISPVEAIQNVRNLLIIARQWVKSATGFAGNRPDPRDLLAIAAEVDRDPHAMGTEMCGEYGGSRALQDKPAWAPKSRLSLEHCQTLITLRLGSRLHSVHSDSRSLRSYAEPTVI